MDSENNPFNPGAGYPPPELVGRDYLISEFRISLGRRIKRRHGKHVFLIGLRGVGKTVLLNHACSIAGDMEYEVIFREVKAAGSDTGGFLHFLAADIGDLLPNLTKGLAARASEKIRKALGTFSVSFSPDGVSIRLEPNPNETYSDSVFIERDLTNLFVSIGEAAAEQRRGILVAIDEVQDLTEQELAAVIAAAHRVDQLQLPILLIGAGLPHLPGKAGDAKSYAERLIEFPELGRLPKDDAKAALVLPAEREGVKIQEKALERMVAESEGYPYFIQEWGKRAWDTANSGIITTEDVKAAERLVEESLDKNFFQVRIGRLTPKEMEYLQAMASLGPGPYRSSDISKQLGVGSRNISVRRQSLINKGMIYSPTYGEQAFSVPLFAKYLKRAL